ncbi:HD-GYP domain-containing protein [Ferviditalea candida]|uniref:HD domain-containing phosphohydrolase n=1 Tax=Ferviditalea candida TaxID=3108399 RepID=A0ABU5ZID4_9BACL|nr:HD domain-containing phosphohydrolase [Paenibacillaceae bacterium T2]
MRFVHVDSVEPGDRLGRTIYTGGGTVLLADNVQLTVYMINTLKRIGVTMVYIKDEHFDDVEIEDVVSEETKRMVINKMSEMFESLRSGKEFNTRHVSVSVDRLLDEIMINKHVLAQLSDIRTEDNQQYLHALNVCIMSVLIGINVGLNQLQLKDLAIGALLHDIGKVGIEGEETGRNHHTWRGFEIIKAKREISLLAAHIALQHHEALNGQGIPRGLDANNIHLYAKIVAVANTFDNLISDFTEGKAMQPHVACEHVSALAGTKLDHDLVLHFLKTVSAYPTGTSVRLSTRETGVVVNQHRGLPGRPVVRVVKQEDEELVIKELDLAKNPTVFIESVIG